ncbi:MAG: ATP-dependent zinc metalloprotease FtsH [Polyangiaceae bacterium]|nr:ATP-dependent zinc metalloprotease FtsH [Polyangiaceae bacterium]
MTDIVRLADSGRVTHATFSPTDIVVEVRAEGDAPAEKLAAARIPEVPDDALVTALVKSGTTIEGKPERTPWWGALLAGILPFIVLGGLVFLLSAGSQGKGRPISFGRSKAKLYDRSKEAVVTFADVAGADEAKAELAEVVDYLKDPVKYSAVGARIPKGVLVVGPPGTGKTLLARAVAGESGCPFFSLSGSEFVEMFVGVGAARARDLFEQAKERAPCIVFIDELDAIGKTRSGGGGLAINEEREQTLNQLLVEMDGFDSGKGLIIMAATNRPEVLDRALLRAGRFDRQVVVDRPDLRGREAILRVHSQRVKLAEHADLRKVAQRTPGMVGADLANVVNEAALASVRRGANAVEPTDFEEAVDRLQLGLKKEGRVMSPEEKRRVAYHEAGHALVALTVENADPVHRVTIIPRSVGALGATLQLPTDDRYLVTRCELVDRLCVMMGGRAAEDLACKDISTGAQDDLERATELARHMVMRFGMSDRLGPQTFGRTGGLRYLGLMDGEERNYGEETARTIDAEVKSILGAAWDRARKLVADRRDELEDLAAALLDKETLERDEIELLVGIEGIRKKRTSGTASRPAA